jgi:glycosyltransferase involved in cell wall biosynthesis
MSLVTVIIPCFNYGWIVAETLDSLLQQTYSQWEAIIIDDGSTDNTRTVAENYASRDERFRYVYQHNAGLSAARNTGLKLAKGKYIQFLDSDDLLSPFKFEKQVGYLEDNADVDLVYGDVRYFMHGGGLERYSRSHDMLDQEWLPSVPDTADGLLNALIRRNIMVVNAPLVRASVVQRVGFFNTSLRSYEDWEYWLRCALAGVKIYFDPTPDVWAKVRVHPTSMSQNLQRMSKTVLRVREMLAVWLQERQLFAAVSLNEECVIEYYLSMAQYNMLQGSLVLGIRSFWELARRSGRYNYYLKSIPFWLRKRIHNRVSNQDNG